MPANHDVRGARPLTLRASWLPLAVTVIVGAALLTQVWVHQRSISLAYAMSDLQASLSSLRLQRAELELEQASLTTPKRLINEAELVHGLHAPRPEQIVTARRGAR